MKVPVHMLAFLNKGDVREVEIPDDEVEDAVSSHEVYATDAILNLVYHYGQNDFQPIYNKPSVSVGDVIELDGKYWMVAPIGFKSITQEEFDSLEGRIASDPSIITKLYSEND